MKLPYSIQWDPIEMFVPDIPFRDHIWYHVARAGYRVESVSQFEFSMSHSLITNSITNSG